MCFPAFTDVASGFYVQGGGTRRATGVDRPFMRRLENRRDLYSLNALRGVR